MRYYIDRMPSEIFFRGEVFEKNPLLRTSLENSINHTVLLSRQDMEGIYIDDTEVLFYFDPGEEMYRSHDKDSLFDSMVNGYRDGVQSFLNSLTGKRIIFDNSGLIEHLKKRIEDWGAKARLGLVVSTSNFRKIGFYNGHIFKAKEVISDLQSTGSSSNNMTHTVDINVSVVEQLLIRAEVPGKPQKNTREISTRAAAMVCVFRGEKLSKNKAVEVFEGDEFCGKDPKFWGFYDYLANISFSPEDATNARSITAHLRQLQEAVDWLEKEPEPLARAKEQLASDSAKYKH